MNDSINSYDDLVNAIIRPPRETYSISDLGPKEFSIQGQKCVRKDVILINAKGEEIRGSHFEPESSERANAQLPCVVYCHGNCGSRLDALPLVVALLPHNITVFCMDFTGSGRSNGEYVSLGWFEKEDLHTVMEYLRSQKSVSTIGLWGQSMGAVTCLMYAATDPSIAGLVVDSPFSNLKKLCEELCRRHSKIPLFVCKLVLKFIRNSILKKARFDINRLDILKYAKQCYSPCKFFYPKDDDFVDPSHSKKLHQVYAGEKSITEFEGDHNSQRPEFFYDSAAIFFHNVLMCDKLVAVPRKPKERSARSKVDKISESIKLLELDSTGFREFSDALKHSESEQLYKLDDRINYLMNRNRKEELKQTIRTEDKETQQAILQSMCTYTEEREKDEGIIETLNRIGYFRQLSDIGEGSLDSENLLNELQPSNSNKISSDADNIGNLRKVLSVENYDEETESKSA